MIAISDLIFGNDGLRFLHDLQKLSPEFDLLFKLITLLGETPVLIIIIATIYWIANKRVAIGLALVLSIGGFINGFFKGLFGVERPFVSDPSDVKKLASAKGYSFPSGHSQATGTFWSFSFLETTNYPHFRRRGKITLMIIGVLLLFLVPLSRVYLGIHWPGDVLVGAIEGILIGIIFFVLYPKVWEKVKYQSDETQILAIFIISLFIAWGSTVITSISGNDVIVGANWELPGVLTGFTIGLVLERKYIQFDTLQCGQRKQAVFRIIIGFFILIGIYYGLKIAFAPFEEIEILSNVAETTLMFPLDFVRLTIVGIAGSFAIPFVFVNLEKKYGITNEPACS